MDLTIGTALQGGKYILNQTLGKHTFRAAQQNRSVILKTLNLQAPGDRTAQLQPWLEKVRALVQCRHPALAAVLDWFEVEGQPFAVMEDVAGQSLFDRVAVQGGLAEAEALTYIRQVGSALSLLHRQGLIHQDVKPGNLIQPKGANLVVLVDFGVGGQVGTPGFSGQEYAAIEQFRSPEKPTPATDIYALAASLYFLLTGHPPIAAPLRHHTPLIPPRQLQPHLSPAVEAAILSGMELQPATRPQTIAAWFSILDGQTRTSSGLNGLVPHPTAIELPALSATPFSSPISPSATPDAPVSKPVIAAQSAPHFSPQNAPQNFAPRRRFPRAFVVGGLLAGSIGIGMGLVLRVSGGTGPGSSFFHTEQAFPKLKDSTGSTPAGDQTVDQKLDQKFVPSPADPPAAKLYSPAPTSPNRRVPLVERSVDRSAPSEAETPPVDPKTPPKSAPEAIAPVIRPSPSSNAAPIAPAESTEPAPPLPVAPSSVPTIIPAPPAVRPPKG